MPHSLQFCSTAAIATHALFNIVAYTACLFEVPCRVTSVAVNAFHDQLILSGGSDARVNLWRVSSVSSAPLLELGEDDMTEGSTKKNEPKLAPDICIRGHEDHDDSVCGVAWSAHTAWVYASLSHSGKLVVSQVPSHEKYKILL